MGASLAHLMVLDVNITRKKLTFCETTIDVVYADPVVKANTVFPFQSLALDLAWDITKDVWFRIVWIPLMTQPVSYPANSDTPPKHEDGSLLYLRPFTLKYPESGLWGDMGKSPGSHVDLNTPLVLMKGEQEKEENIVAKYLLKDFLTAEELAEFEKEQAAEAAEAAEAAAEKKGELVSDADITPAESIDLSDSTAASSVESPSVESTREPMSISQSPSFAESTSLDAPH